MLPPSVPGVGVFANRSLTVSRMFVFVHRSLTFSSAFEFRHSPVAAVIALDSHANPPDNSLTPVLIPFARSVIGAGGVAAKAAMKISLSCFKKRRPRQLLRG